jgi:hypothetical protein
MHNPPRTRVMSDRRDVRARPASACPACASSKVSVMTRTDDLIYLGCDECWHVWSVSKPGHENILRPPAVFTRADSK